MDDQTLDDNKETEVLNDAVAETTEDSLLSSLQDQILHLSADLQNVRRRADIEKTKARFEGGANVVLSLAKTLDDLHRAFSHLPEDIVNHPFIISLQAVEKNIQKMMNEHHIIFFGEEGDIFDEKLHESLMMDATKPQNILAQVFEKGILYKGEVIRHAKVSVGSQ